MSNKLLECPIRERVKEINSFLESNATQKVKEDKEGKRVYWVIRNPRKRQEFKEKISERYQLNRVMNLLPRNTLISMVSEFDYFISELLNNIYRFNHDYIKSSQRAFNFQEIMTYGSLDEIIDSVIEKEIENVLRSSHSEQFSYLEKKFSINTLKKFDSWGDFIELTERRNLFVHTNGRVSKQYLAVCEREKYKANANYGDVVHVDDEYLKKAHRIIYEVIFKLNHVILNVVLKKDSEKLNLINLQAINIVFDLLCREDYPLVDSLCEFLLSKDYSISSEKYKRIIIINQCLSLKYQGNDIYKKKIDALDWSSSSDLFILARSCVLDEHENSCKILEKIMNSSLEDSGLARHSFHDWPLFKNLRTEKLFLELYKKMYNESYDDISIVENEPQTPEQEQTTCLD
ncbi:TPA: hypothetical protein SMR43_003617 [Proteus mirabilis]|uniref:hypothetical protein n=1 Tax=Proteus mirabilis TaxID=584 RepID=UPI0018C80E03|nr:hypothetical protein [Proteus mirabilis]HEK0329323.1 hypothetical protein [Proteus mirabilis]HEK1721300.1 hypothetical protein [Proteus mirabilis]HEK2022043.1 hypothetical protein [Proteus mirabilis]HEK2099656.1 hypothetical protein [Proteus mirabilis]